jgi:hypothetical protein
VAGADEHPQAEGGRGVEGQWCESAAVGAQDVGEQVGVEAVVLVTGGAVAGAQGGDRRAVTWRLAMTNTVRMASSRGAWTTGRSQRA